MKQKIFRFVYGAIMAFAMCMLPVTLLLSCNGDEPESSENTENSENPNTPDVPDAQPGVSMRSVVISADGIASDGSTFSWVDESQKTFYLDFVKYCITDAHIEVVGCDRTEVASQLNGKVTLYSNIRVNNTDYRVTAIGEDAFKSFEELKEIVLPNALISISERAFACCTGLTSSVTFPNSVTEIGYSAFFDCKGLTSVTLSNSLTKIGSYAFNGTGFKTITIPENVEFCGDDAFTGCDDLEEVIFNAIKCDDYDGQYGYNLFSTNVKRIIFGNKVQRIPADFANGCSNVTDIKLPDSVTEIGSSAFNGTGLKTITIPENVEFCGAYAFTECDDLEEVIFNAIKCDDYGQYEYNLFSTNVKRIIFGNKVQRIPADFASGCSNVTDIKLPDSVTEIGSSAFNGTGLKTITIPENVEFCGAYAFTECDDLEEVIFNAIKCDDSGQSGYNLFSTNVKRIIFGNKVQRIPANFASGCSNVTDIKLPDSVTEIGSSAFNGTSLTSIALPNSVTEIGAFAFCGTNLTSIALPNSLTKIGGHAFFGCPFTELIIPKNVISIGYLALGWDVIKIRVEAVLPPKCDRFPFADYYGSVQNTLLEVPAESLEAYKSTEPWKFFSQIEPY